MMNNMKLMNDMDLEMVTGGDAYAHGSGASGGWDEEYGTVIHGGGVSGGWGAPEPIIAEPVVTETVIEETTEVIIVMMEEEYTKPNRRNKKTRGSRK